MDEQAIITLSIEGTKLLLRGSKEVLAALVAAIRYSADKMNPGAKMPGFFDEYIGGALYLDER